MTPKDATHPNAGGRLTRQAKGGIREVTGRDGAVTYYARFRAYGKRVERKLGSSAEGYTRAKAEQDLGYLVADAERGKWSPTDGAPAAEPENPEVPTFHEFASEWYEARKREWSESTQASYLYELRLHLLPFFGKYRLNEIDVALVDAYKERKLAEGKMSGSYINKTLARLGAILDVADERELIGRNPYRVNTRNRRVKNVKKATRRYLDRPAQIVALLDAAAELDREARADRRSLNRHGLIAVLIFGGLRISEALDLTWGHVDLATGRLAVPGTKSDAAVREFTMKPALAEVLRAMKATAPATASGDLIFPTATGKRHDKNHTRSRVLVPAIERANLELEAAGHPLIPVGKGRGKNLDQHGLRHTHVSLRVAVGDDAATISRDVGHADLETTFRIYTHVMELEEGHREALAAILQGAALPGLDALIGGKRGKAPETAPRR